MKGDAPKNVSVVDVAVMPMKNLPELIKRDQESGWKLNIDLLNSPMIGSFKNVKSML